MKTEAFELQPPLAVEEVVSSSLSYSRARDFYELTKPRMNLLVVITTMVGFYMASLPGILNWILLFQTLLGTAMLAASASIFNQLLEREYDARMPRTRNRPLPTGKVAPIEAFTFGMILGISGTLHLAFAVNPLTAMLGLLTLLSYVLIYTPMKRTTSLNTVIGAVPGAIPPMMGFTAVTDTISPGAIVLFGILFLWQMPHFLAIATLYKDDYTAGGFKMLPNVSASLTAKQIVIYTLALIPVSILPTMLNLAGAIYFTIALLLGVGFLLAAIRAARSRERIDSRKLFFASIIYLPLLLAAMMADKM
jgi:protoheme IX farnesyltransferase